MTGTLRVFVASIAVALTLLVGVAPLAHAETLTGVVQDESATPIPGLTVFLVHPSVGRSYPKVTDVDGRFYFLEVPAIDTPYYLEVYWGRDLVYRRSMSVRGDVVLPPIRLD